MKKILTIIFVCILCSTALIGCNLEIPNKTTPTEEATNSKLATPFVIINEEGVASWASIANAIGYSYVINENTPINTTNTSVTLSNGDSIKVMAVGDGVKYANSDFSIVQTYTSSNNDDTPTQQESVKLATPIVTVSENGVASWVSIANATSYLYIINENAPVNTTNTSVTLSNGDSIKVMALGDGINYTNSNYSTSVTYESENGGSDYEYDTINSLTTDSEYLVMGVVGAITNRSFVISDDTGSVLVFRGTSWNCDVEIGDIVLVLGTPEVYGGAIQFGQSSEYEVAGSESIRYPNPTIITNSIAQSLVNYKNNVSVNYVSLTGTLDITTNKNNTYYNINIDGLSGIYGSISYPINTSELDGLNGQEVTVVGYFVGITGSSDSYINICATSVVLSSEQPTEPDVPTEEPTDQTKPNIYTKSDYYHYLEANQVQSLTSYFTVEDVQDGIINVTSQMISGSIKSGENEITLTVTDSDNNTSSLTITIYVEEYTTYSNSETIAIIDDWCMPSTGNVNVLVLPIAFPEYSATNSMLTTIEKAFFGTEAETGWESLKTFYQESSYGKLNISGDVLPWYTPKNSQSYYANYNDDNNYIYGSTMLMVEALEYYKNSYDYGDYDSNNDNIIDAVYMIYNVPIGGDESDAEYQFYWAFTYWDLYADERNYADTLGYSYVFMGYDFLEDKLQFSTKDLTINTHTIIHETGHLMNLDDYYDYDENDTYNNDGGYVAADMMDWNFGDHGPFSKIMLDWIDPVVINKSGVYVLPSFTKTGTTFLISSSNTFNSIFSSYYLIDFYTFDGLNSLECPAFFNTSKSYAGVRVSLANASLIDDGQYLPYFEYNNTDSKYKVLQMLEADYNGTFDLGKYDNKGAQLDDFYLSGDTFGIGSYQTFKSADGKYIPFIMEVLSINENYATIYIQFK